MTLGVIEVICGANREEFGNLHGKTVGYLRRTLKEVLNLPDESKVTVNGGDGVNDDHPLKTGDVVEFLREAGDKGEI